MNKLIDHTPPVNFKGVELLYKVKLIIGLEWLDKLSKSNETSSLETSDAPSLISLEPQA